MNCRFTDLRHKEVISACDLTQELVNEIGVEVLPMEFHMEDKSYLHYPDCRMMSLSEFYSKLKDGIDSKTTQINYDSFYKSFENYLKSLTAIIQVLYVPLKPVEMPV